MTDRGLTLVEVLVALVVASVTMAAVARSTAAVRLGERDSEMLQAASLLAELGLERQIARGALALVEEHFSEAIDEPLGRFERQTTVERGPRENLWHVVVSVTPPRAAPAQSVHTLLRRPWALP